MKLKYLGSLTEINEIKTNGIDGMKDGND